MTSKSSWSIPRIHQVGWQSLIFFKDLLRQDRLQHSEAYPSWPVKVLHASRHGTKEHTSILVNCWIYLEIVSLLDSVKHLWILFESLAALCCRLHFDHQQSRSNLAKSERVDKEGHVSAESCICLRVSGNYLCKGWFSRLWVRLVVAVFCNLLVTSNDKCSGFSSTLDTSKHRIVMLCVNFTGHSEPQIWDVGFYRNPDTTKDRFVWACTTCTNSKQNAEVCQCSNYKTCWFL